MSQKDDGGCGCLFLIVALVLVHNCLFAPAAKKIASAKSPQTRSASILSDTLQPAVMHSRDVSQNPDALVGNRDIAKALVYQLERGETENMLSYKRYEGGGAQAVFVKSGRRYTVYWSGKPSEGPGFLSFWVRPNGTHGRDELLTFTDDGIAGKVSFGIGAGDTAEERRWYQEESARRGFTATAHPEFFDFWQNRYFTALGDAEATILDF